MANHFKMTATQRERAGKGNARATRREGKVPAVIYGDNKPPVMIALEKMPIAKALHSGHFFTHLCDIEIDGQKHTVLARDVQFNPVKDTADHIDFLRVSEKTTITVEVPVHFTGHEKSPGIKAGGVLTVIAHTVEVKCRADQIPDELVIDLSTLEMGESIKVSDIKFPNGVKAVGDIEQPVATLSEASEEGEFVAAASAAEVETTAQKAVDPAAEAAAAAAATAAAKEGKKKDDKK